MERNRGRELEGVCAYEVERVEGGGGTDISKGRKTGKEPHAMTEKKRRETPCNIHPKPWISISYIKRPYEFLFG